MLKGLVSKTIFSFLALTAAGNACAQEARLHNFADTQAPTFLVLTPTPEASSFVAETLAAQFPAQQPLDQPDPPASDALAIAKAQPLVLLWMRVGGSVAQRRLPASFGFMRDPQCSKTGFLERFGLSLIAQQRRQLVFDAIVAAACAAGVPVRLFDALVSQESRYQPFARSWAGAIGIAQLMPTSAGRKQSSNNVKGSNDRLSNIGACNTANSPPNINPTNEAKAPLIHAAISAKCSNDAQAGRRLLDNRK